MEGNTFSKQILIFNVALSSWVETSTKQCGQRVLFKDTTLAASGNRTHDLSI